MSPKRTRVKRVLLWMDRAMASAKLLSNANYLMQYLLHNKKSPSFSFFIILSSKTNLNANASASHSQRYTCNVELAYRTGFHFSSLSLSLAQREKGNLNIPMNNLINHKSNPTAPQTHRPDSLSPFTALITHQPSSIISNR